MKPTFFTGPLMALSVAFVAASGLSQIAHAQGPLAEVGDPTFDELPSPDVQISKNKSFKPKDWLEAEASITIPATSNEQKKVGYVDEALVKWYVAIEDEATKKLVLLTKEITHINVPIEEEFFSSVYLSPSTQRRLTGTDRSAKGKVKAIALEVLVDGRKVGEASTMNKKEWWNAPSLSRTDAFPLLNKYETPFKMFWWDRYAEIREER